MQALLYCHDKIASRDFVPQLAPADDVTNGGLDDGGHMTVIQFIKNSEPLVSTCIRFCITKSMQFCENKTNNHLLRNLLFLRRLVGVFCVHEA